MIPTHIFLDTNVFDSQQYNFDSAVFRTFTAAARDKKIRLLLPHPTDLEIRRHIRERSADALKALHEARRAAPFLKKWEHFPKDSVKQTVDYEITRVAGNEWNAFKSQFVVQELDYKGINVGRVMHQYDRALPPFGHGKKRKEFPDAFAIAILEVFAELHEVTIALVSKDPDIRKACESRPRFLSFETLPELTELLVLGSAVLDSTRDVILADTDVLHDAVLNEAIGNLSYYHELSSYTLLESEVEKVEFEDVRVVGLGKNEATIAFEALISTDHYMEWTEQDWDDEDTPQRRHILDAGTVHGVAKVFLDPLVLSIREVVSVEFDEAELAVSEAPRHR